MYGFVDAVEGVGAGAGAVDGASGVDAGVDADAVSDKDMLNVRMVVESSRKENQSLLHQCEKMVAFQKFKAVHVTVLLLGGKPVCL